MVLPVGGRFEDGSDGSPIILARHAAKHSNVKVVCIERNPALYERLKKNLSGFPFAETINEAFSSILPRVGGWAAKYTVFLYIDPFTVYDLEWKNLDSVFKLVKETKTSLEVLINFNSPALVRCALAALGREVPTVDGAVEDPDALDATDTSIVSPRALIDRIVGGNWWADVVSQTNSFPNHINHVVEVVLEMLGTRFAEVGAFPIRARPEHKIPKYHLLFGTRHSDGLILMNDATVTSRGASLFCLDLFSKDDLKTLILNSASASITRGDLITSIIRNEFASWTWAEIRGVIEELLKEGQMESETGKPQINNSVRIWRRKNH